MTENKDIPINDLTARDWFAGMALQGELASQHPEAGQWDVQKVTVRAYELADAMMIERQK